MNYLEHLENHCGEFVDQFEFEDLLEEHIQFLKFKDSPCEGAYSITSLGLHWHGLQFEDRTIVHQEVMVTTKQDDIQDDMVMLLWNLSNHALETGHAFNLGEYFKLPKGIFKKYKFSSIYVTAPFYFEESFRVYEGDLAKVLPVWFVPIFKSEEKYIEKYGQENFENLLFDTSTELVDFKRKPLV